MAARELQQGGVERIRTEVGPQRVAAIELGVGRLPDQEVRRALLARGPQEQVDVGQAGLVEGEEGGEVVAAGDVRAAAFVDADDAARGDLGEERPLSAFALFRGDGGADRGPDGVVGLEFDEQPNIRTVDIDGDALLDVRLQNPSLANRRYTVVPSS